MTHTESVKNQDIRGKFVAREVKACFSYEMEAVLKAGAECSHTKDLPSYDEIENLYELRCPKCGNPVKECEDEEKDAYWLCEYCDIRLNEEPDSEPQEIFEWWIVTEYLYEKLKAKGEPVLEWGNNYYWGRTTTGQAIAMDSVIGEICSEMEILSGQKYDWSK